MDCFVKQNKAKGEYDGFLVNTGDGLQQVLRTKLSKEQVLPDLSKVKW